LKVVAVIPALDEAQTIRDIAERARREADALIVVDDGSTDGTAERLAGLDLVVVRRERNLGKADSLWDGIQRALAMGADAIVTLDGDGQHRPEDIGRLTAVHAKHPQSIVIGARLHDRSQFPVRRYYANRFAGFWISWAAGYPIADTQSGFRVYPASLFSQFARSDFRGDRFVFESEVLIRAARRGFFSVATRIPGIYPNQARPSHFRPVADIAKIVLMVAGQLLRRGMHPAGLWRSLRRARVET